MVGLRIQRCAAAGRNAIPGPGHGAGRASPGGLPLSLELPPQQNRIDLAEEALPSVDEDDRHLEAVLGEKRGIVGDVPDLECEARAPALGPEGLESLVAEMAALLLVEND